jgi:cytochrome c-type biogenesis protein CcmE
VKKIAVPGLLILAGMVGLIAMGILSGAIPEVGVQQLSSPEFSGAEVRLLGVIHAIESDIRPMRFTIRDMKDPSSQVIVEVDDHRPDIFKVDTDVAVVGRYDSGTRVFAGTKLFTKCPSKYEATGGSGSVDVYGSGSAPPPAIGEPAAAPAEPPPAAPIPAAGAP